MKLHDMNTERVYTLSELWEEWEEFHYDDPMNHAESFVVEFFEILMATINGRNDCEIVGLTPREISNYIIRIGHGIGLLKNVKREA